MNEETQERIAARLAKTLALMCVRNTFLEELHQGRIPKSASGDYADVRVIDAEGEIPWNEVSRLNDEEMRRLMKQIVNQFYTFFLKNDDPYFLCASHRTVGQ